MGNFIRKNMEHTINKACKKQEISSYQVSKLLAMKSSGYVKSSNKCDGTNMTIKDLTSLEKHNNIHKTKKAIIPIHSYTSIYENTSNNQPHNVSNNSFQS